jgi:hypothetical protein
MPLLHISVCMPEVLVPAEGAKMASGMAPMPICRVAPVVDHLTDVLRHAFLGGPTCAA